MDTTQQHPIRKALAPASNVDLFGLWLKSGDELEAARRSGDEHQFHAVADVRGHIIDEAEARGIDLDELAAAVTARLDGAGR